ncbi:MAG: Wzz/FepE/Etk N-terminal domain-containing protein [Bacilli bacterium]|jgi:capsular polysaccharide biosynthesis protein|nr:Wzz/FepE/Etk N-terminal domain-containing protein [Bacilli bacterium]
MMENGLIGEENRGLSVGELFRIFWRNLWKIILITLIGVIAGVTYSSRFVTPKYTATGYLTYKNTINSEIANTLNSTFSSSIVAERVVENLEITFANGKAITTQDIISGISSNAVANSSRTYAVSFSSSDPSIVVKVINESIDTYIDFLSNNDSFSAIAPNVSIYQKASSYAYTGTSKKIIVLAFSLAFFVISTFVFAYIDIDKGVIRGKSDVFDFGFREIFLLNSDKKKKSLKEIFSLQTLKDLFRPKTNGPYQADSILDLQNFIDGSVLNKQVRTILLSQIKPNYLGVHLASDLAKVYALNGKKTLIIDTANEVKNHSSDIVSLAEGSAKEIASENGVAYISMPDSPYLIDSLKSQKVDSYIIKLISEFDYIIINTNNVVNDSIPLLLGKYADAIVLPVVAGVDNKKQFTESFNRLATIKENALPITVLVK